MTHTTDTLFDQLGPVPAPPCESCPGDDDLAALIDGALPATQARAIEDHALVCSATRAILSAVTEANESPARAPSAVMRIVAAVKGRGLQLLNAADLTLRDLAGSASPAPALGGLRGDTATSGIVVLNGPGEGLDSIDMQVQSDGSVRLTVSGDLPESPTGELRSVLLEADGLPLEKRPYAGEPVSLGPLEPGARYRVALVTRLPGEELRSVSETLLDLTAA